MKRVLQLKIENFRGIKSADLTFDGHTLLVSGNSVGKSTVCDAVDLVLGPDQKVETVQVATFAAR